MKHAFRFLLTFAFVCSAAASAARAQTPTPDPFVTQITSSTGDTYARDISGDGRFVVIESSGDISTVPPNQTAATKSPNNSDGNREIFLFDYAQRRIFQITDTRSQLVDPARAVATRFALDNIRVEVSNNRPMISRDGRFIVFSSNGFDPADAASTPSSFDGNAAGIADRLRADGNQELFLYRVPDVPAAVLSSGDTAAYVELRQNSFTRVTNTAASRLPRAGTTTTAPFVADDNRSAQINDDGSRVVFISTRNIAPTSLRNNADASPEVFALSNGTLVQLTDITAAAFNRNPLAYIDNPNISGTASGDSVVAFLSNATDLRTADQATNVAAGNADGNSEIFVVTFNGAAVTSTRQATRTRRAVVQDLINLLSPGRRLSSSGQFIAFESVAANPKADSATNEPNRFLYVYNVTTDTFTQITERAANDEADTVIRFPTFTGDNTRLVFATDLNLTPTGTRLPSGDAAGLNPSRSKQIFSAPLPASGNAVTVSRLTNTASATTFNTLQPFASNTQERIAFSLAGVELGGGNADQANEAFYLVVPPAPAASDTPAASSALVYLTGASRRDVGAPSAGPPPTPAPVTGLSPGMIGFVRRTAQSPALSPVTKRICPVENPGCDAASESQRRPPLPVELAGVSLSVNGAAAGLYFVGPEEIQFVVPPGLATQTGTTTYPVVINIRGEGGAAVRTIRSTLQVPPAQPDIFTSTNGPGGRAAVTNVTNPLLAVGTNEPFTVTTTFANAQGQTVTEATLLRLVLTGVRGVARANVTVRIVKADNTTVDITGDQIPRDPQATDMPGVFTLDFRLPASLAAAGEVRVIVLVNVGGTTFASRPADTAPGFRIN